MTCGDKCSFDVSRFPGLKETVRTGQADSDATGTGAMRDPNCRVAKLASLISSTPKAVASYVQ